MTVKQIVVLLALSAIWGGSFPFMRLAAPALGPVLLIELRVGLAGLTLLAFGLLTRSLPDWRQQWRSYLVVGAMNSALPFLLFAFASLTLPASVTAVLNATTPLFGLLVAIFWLGEKLTLRKAAGLAVGFGGVISLMGMGPLPLTPQVLTAAGASLLGALSYGTAAVYTKVRAGGAQPRAMATYSQLFAALLIAPLLPFALPKAAPGPLVVGSVLALALLCTALAYLLYFYLILHAGPTRATLVTYLTPAFSSLWGALLLQEKVGLGNLVGFGLILCSVALVSGAQQGATAGWRPLPGPWGGWRLPRRSRL